MNIILTIAAQFIFFILIWRLYANLWTYYFNSRFKQHPTCRILLWLILFLPTTALIVYAQVQLDNKLPHLLGL